MRQTTYIKFDCVCCGKERSMTKSRYNGYAKKQKTPPKFCSFACFSKDSKKTKIQFNCELCGKNSVKSPKDYNRAKHHFCSKKCSMRWQNVKTNKCVDCKTLIYSTQTRCVECNKIKKDKLTNSALADLRYSGPNKYNLIRFYAKKIIANQEKICQNCNYSKHVEVCHIKPVSKFPDTAKLDEVNHLDNLLLLCPNCHYEFDHFLDIRKQILLKTNRSIQI